MATHIHLQQTIPRSACFTQQSNGLPQHRFRKSSLRLVTRATPTETTGTFSSGEGKPGTVSATTPGPTPSTSAPSDSLPSDPSRPPASSETIKEALEMARLFLLSELTTIFQTGKLTKEKYTTNFKFQDPIARYSGFEAFATNLRILRALFKIDFTLHSVKVTGDNELTTRWSMELKPRLTPWLQKLVFTGRSFYSIDVFSGKLAEQRDVWDAVSNDGVLSLEAVAHLVSQVLNVQVTPRLDQPKYTVLKKKKDYEIRRYQPYLAAEVSMPSTSGPAGGDGFNDLAGYIFGGNTRGTKMEMTTPVFTTAGQGPDSKMEFPIQERFGPNAESLPIPNNARVTRTKQDGATVAATNFSGLPLDFQVTEAERKLRGALLLDGLKANDSYKLARYNDPFTLPFARRNEVLIRLEDYELED